MGFPLNGVPGRRANHTCCESFLKPFNEVGITLLAAESCFVIPAILAAPSLPRYL